jgi:hypothetical protein
MRALIILVALSVLGVAAPAASAVADFETPAGAAYCGTDHFNGDTLICWTPNDGFSLILTLGDRTPSHRYVRGNVGFHDVVGRLLRFGQSWASHRPAIRGFRCKSERSGLTCVNAKRHGFWLGRYRGYRVW